MVATTVASLLATVAVFSDMFDVPTHTHQHTESSTTSAPSSAERSSAPAPLRSLALNVSLPLKKSRVVIVEQKHQYICEYTESRSDEKSLLKSVGLGGGCAPRCPALEAQGGSCIVLTTASQATLDRADAIIYHPGRNLPVEKMHPTQWTAMWYGESKEKHPEKYERSYLQRYDAHVVYEPWSSYRFSWTQRFKQDFLGLEKTRKRWVEWSKRRTAVAVVSNCLYHTTNRTEVMREIDTLLQAFTNKKEKLYMFGSCHPGRGKDSIKAEHPECAKKHSKDKYKEKLCVLRQYRYVVSLDNSRDNGYVTEKVYHALLAGTVPIYAGAPDIESYIPLPNSVVHIDPKASLAPLVRRLVSQEDRQAPPLETRWWDLPSAEWSDAFQKNLNLVDPSCTICHDIARGLSPQDASVVH